MTQSAVDSLQLPAHAYVPGRTPRHADGFLDHILDLADPVTTEKDAHRNDAWLFGLRLLEHGYYWEAHEVLERVWLNALPNSLERNFVQAMIHLANAALKIRMDREDAAVKLGKLALRCVEESALRQKPQFMGIDIQSLRRSTPEFGPGASEDSARRAIATLVGSG